MMDVSSLCYCAMLEKNDVEYRTYRFAVKLELRRSLINLCAELAEMYSVLIDNKEARELFKQLDETDLDKSLVIVKKLGCLFECKRNFFDRACEKRAKTRKCREQLDGIEHEYSKFKAGVDIVPFFNEEELKKLAEILEKQHEKVVRFRKAWTDLLGMKQFAQRVSTVDLVKHVRKKFCNFVDAFESF